MNSKLTLPQTALITLTTIVLILAIFDLPGLSICSVLVTVLFVVIAALSEIKNIFISTAVVILTLIFFINPVYIASISLNCIIPGIVIGGLTRKVLNHESENVFEPIFMGIIAFILGLILNYVVSKYMFNIDMLQRFTSSIKQYLSMQMNMIQEYSSNLTSISNVTEDSIIQEILNIMPLMLFFRGMSLAIVTYFLAIFALKVIKKIDLKNIRFSKFYLPGNAVVTSFVFYIFIMLLEVFNIPLYTDLILINLEMIFYLLFLVQGLSVAMFFMKKWIKRGDTIKIVMSIFGIIAFGIMGICILGMLDCVFDFRKVKDCELI